MPSALQNLIKCLMICKTKCHIKSKCSKCMDFELHFQEGPSHSSESCDKNILSNNNNKTESDSLSLKTVYSAISITSSV